MKKEWICSICGQSTFDVDMDYLIGYDHLSCALKLQTTKIENWNKLEGQRFDVLGVSMFLKDASSSISQSDIYTVWVYETITNSPEALMRINLFFPHIQTLQLIISISSPQRQSKRQVYSMQKE